MVQGVLKSPGKIADCLARQAHFLGKDPDYMSPFIKEQKEVHDRGDYCGELPPAWKGGKEDDVTVTVA